MVELEKKEEGSGIFIDGENIDQFGSIVLYLSN
jgi:hypothetical protein